MKKLIQLLMIITLVFFVVGCGSDEPVDENNNNDDTEEQVENNKEYEQVADEPVLEGFIVMEVRDEGDIITAKYSTKLDQEEAISIAEAWAIEEGYVINDNDIAELLEEEGYTNVNTDLISITTEANYENYDGETMIEIKMFK